MGAPLGPPGRGRRGEQLYERDDTGAFLRDEQGSRVPKLERARLDLRWEAPPEEPRGYGDVVVSLPTAPSHETKAAAADGATAEEHARQKHRRYPADAVRPGRLCALSVEAYGRWSRESLRFLHHAAGRAAARSPGIQPLGGGGASAILGSWYAQLSCALQKANVAAVRGACGDARLWSDAGAAGDEGTEETGVLAAVDDVLACARALAGLAR